MNATPMSSGGMKGGGTKFTSFIADQTPVFDNRRKHNKRMKKHRGNLRRDPKFLP